MGAPYPGPLQKIPKPDRPVIEGEFEEVQKKHANAPKDLVPYRRESK